MMSIRSFVPLFCLALMLFGVTAGCTLTEVAPTPMPTPDIPRVRFMFPQNGARVAQNAEITVDIVAEDETSGIARIVFLVDGTKINEGAPAASVPVFRVAMNWIAGNLGGHTLHAIAYRPDGTQSDEAIILVDVVAP